MIRKIASAILALAMIAVMVPIAVYADGTAVATVAADGVTPVAAAVAPTTAVVPVPVNTGFAGNLGSMFVLDRLFGGTGGIVGASGGTSLGDMLVLNQLFSNSGINGNNLGTLFALNQLFNGVNSNGLLTPGGTSLGNLFVLDQFFGGGPVF